MTPMMIVGLVCSLVGLGLVIGSRQAILDKRPRESGGPDYRFMFRLGLFLLIAGVFAQFFVLLSE